VVAVFALTLGVFILAGDPPNRTNQALFLFSFGIALSSLAKTFFRGQMDVLPLILMRWGFMIMVLGLFCFIHFFPAGKLSERFLLELIPWFVLFPLLPMLCIIALLTPFPIRYFWQAYFASFPIFAAVMGYYIVDGFWYGLLRRSVCFRPDFTSVRDPEAGFREQSFCLGDPCAWRRTGRSLWHPAESRPSAKRDIIHLFTIRVGRYLFHDRVRH
jgi:hypothetical protein